mmetsp:Transcript_44327/g.71264  ORF Transcript_44327/g.71264 Transcript_44327/m.71264 type:complete len:91 (-) Transcript_44327:41-313(-)
MFAVVCNFTSLYGSHSPGGGMHLFSKEANQMFEHIPLTPQPAWADVTAGNIPVASVTSGNYTGHKYMTCEHQAGMVGGVGGYSVGLIHGQ